MMKAQLLESFTVPAGHVDTAPLEYQTDPDWVAIITYVPNEHVELEN